jgi:hypothetical protein
VPTDDRGQELDRWVSEYDYDARTVTLTLATDHHWAMIVRYDLLCDTAGYFTVHTFSNNVVDGESSIALSSRIARVSVTLNDDGDLRAWHPDFDLGVIGSQTVWPFGVAPGRGLRHWIWWSRGSIVRREPRPWDDAIVDPEGLAAAEPTRVVSRAAARRVARRG